MKISQAECLGRMYKLLNKRTKLNEARKAAANGLSAVAMCFNDEAKTASLSQEENATLLALKKQIGDIRDPLNESQQEDFIKGFSYSKETLLSNVRKQKQMTQVQLAEKVGCTQAQIARWESGTITPNSKTVKKLAKALGVHAEEIIDD